MWYPDLIPEQKKDISGKKKISEIQVKLVVQFIVLLMLMS